MQSVSVSVSVTVPVPVPNSIYISLVCSVLLALHLHTSVFVGVFPSTAETTDHHLKLKPPTNPSYMEPSEQVDDGTEWVDGNSEASSSTASPCAPSQSALEAMDKSFRVMKVSSPLSSTTACSKNVIHSKNHDVCTEILGCETGVKYTVSDYNRDLLLLTSLGCNVGAKWEAKREEKRMKKRNCRGASSGFPPPLTVLSGESRLRVVSERDNGRLLLFSVKPSLVMAERKDGRLKLRLLSIEPVGGERGEQTEPDEKKVPLIKDDEEDREEAVEQRDEEGGHSGMEMAGIGSNGNGVEEVLTEKSTRRGGCKEEGGGGAGCLRRNSNTKRLLQLDVDGPWVTIS
ncbi:hypothetical protein BHE74_00052086 [Ensete ventricosum]|nr:hypothetical protein BHE74_00052086 [Ensete ventricosum]